MPRTTILVKEPDSIKRRLGDLGFTEEFWPEVAKEYGSGEASATPFQPTNAPGTLGYLRSTGFCREELTKRGWVKDDAGNWPSTVRADGLVRVAVITGDSHTGQPYDHLIPKTKHPRGPVVADAVDHNAGQLELGMLITGEVPRPKTQAAAPAQDTCMVYLFLVHCTKNEIRCELSCPSEFDGDNISEWHERIVFAPISRQPTPDQKRYTDPDGGTEALDVPVSRK